MSSTDADVVLTIATAPGARLRLRVPEGAVAERAADLPMVDVANLPGATVPVRVGYRADGLTLRAVCATAPSKGWAPGLEDLVLARATQIVRGALGGEVTRFEARDAVVVGARIEQRFDATVKRGEETATARGRHLLGFAGEAREGVLCTVACTEREGRDDCAALVDAAAPEGAWTTAPAPSALVRGILAAADRPMTAGAILVAAAIALAALVIARRPRPRATSRRS
jgi:hypothetical protein